MKRFSQAYTIAELIVVTCTIGILAAVGTISYASVLMSSRDSQRVTKITSIAGALENYYQKNGEYPSCNAMSQPAEIVASEVFVNSSPDMLTMPTATPGTSSILPECEDLTAGQDVIAYIGNSSATCTTATDETAACTKYTLKYYDESKKQIVIVNSRHELIVAETPLAPTMSVVLSGSDIVATIDPVTCSVGTAQYQINSRTDDGEWLGYTSWSVITTASQAATLGVKYGYKSQARCYYNLNTISSAAEGVEATYTNLPVSDPSSAPTIAVSLDVTNILATITPVTCATGTVQYQIDYRLNEGSWTGYTSWSTATTASQAGSQGNKYGYRAQTRCYENESRISNALEGSESTYDYVIGVPSAPVVTTNTVGSDTTWSWDAATCASGTTARYQYVYTITPSGYNSGTLSTSNTSVTNNTNVSGQTYTVSVQAQCYNVNMSSEWSVEGSASYVRPKTFLQIDPGDGTTPCAIASDFKVYCWGENTDGRLGIGTSGGQSNVPVAVDWTGVLAGKTAVQVTSGVMNGCVLASDYRVYCWGDNDYSEIGDRASGTDRLVPTAVYWDGAMSGKTATAVYAGSFHACLLASDQWVYCWGRGNAGLVGNGQLGDGASTTNIEPTAISRGAIPVGVNIKGLSSRWVHSCVVGTNDLSYCWGYNSTGQVGDNSTTARTTPVAVNAASGVSTLYGKTVKAVSVGGYASCAIDNLNLAHCWGYGVDGGLGNAATTTYRVPVAVSMTGALSGLTIKQISAGDDRETLGNYGHACVLASDDWVYCWGRNSNGQLGDDTTTNRSSPTKVLNGAIPVGKTLLNVYAGQKLNCVIDIDHIAYCWGWNTWGTVGDNTTTLRRVPTKVADLP